MVRTVAMAVGSTEIKQVQETMVQLQSRTGADKGRRTSVFQLLRVGTPLPTLSNTQWSTQSLTSNSNYDLFKCFDKRGTMPTRSVFAVHSFIHSFIYLHSSKNIIHNKMYNEAAYATLTVALYNWEIKHYCASRTH